MTTGTRLRLALLVTFIAVVACDRATKYVATTLLAGTPPRSYLGDTVRIACVENTGAFLSLGASLPANLRTALFTGATGLLLLGFAAVAIRNRWSGLRAFGVALLVGGGSSNWIDRAIHGSVVDFMNVGLGPLRTGVFNVADVAIMAGVGMLIAAEFRKGKEAPLSS
jgi:signal peptidase II